MADARDDETTLKGPLADVFVRAVVAGSLSELSRRLGNRAVVDDPLFGRASSLGAIEELLRKLSAHFAATKATYRHVASTTGIDRDVSEGVLVSNENGTTVEAPVAIVAERRRLREIELRVFYPTPTSRRAAPPETTADATAKLTLPPDVTRALDGLRQGAHEPLLATFEEGSRIVDSRGASHAKRDGAMASFLATQGAFDLTPTGAADDGRHCFVEAIKRSGTRSDLAALTFERGESGLLRELRLY